jgi:D-alanyl-D-alanine carboxypeptidase (penicillin-binding protein 5/6)
MARVQRGVDASVPLVASTPIYATVPRAGSGEISLRVVYNGPVKAPIAKGQAIAELEIRAGEQPPGRVPLVAAHSVGTGGPMDRLVNGFKNLFS